MAEFSHILQRFEVRVRPLCGWILFSRLLACSHVDASRPQISNGILDIQDQAVLMLEGRIDAMSEPAICSASLIAPEVLLTAAHCVIDRESKKLRQLKIVGPKTSRVRAVRVHERYAEHERYDIALVKLAGTLPQIQPLAWSSKLPKPGEWVRLVGFGGNQLNGGELGNGSGVRRTGWTRVSHLDDHYIYSKGMRTARPDQEAAATGRDVAPMPGDSGGPMLDQAGTICGVAARINSKALATEPVLSVVAAHTQMAAVQTFMEQSLRELSTWQDVGPAQ